MLKVVVGIVSNTAGEMLICQRPLHKPLGGFWEFPGGKCEQGETEYQALVREFKEEVGIHITDAAHILTIHHHYPEQSVELAIWRILHYQGEAKSMEKQPLQWVTKKQLHQYTFLEANVKIIDALLLPEQYLITGNFIDKKDFLQKLNNALEKGITLMQLRLPEQYWLEELVEPALKMAHQYQAKILLNDAYQYAEKFGFDGVHLNSHRLYQDLNISKNNFLISAACHTMDDIIQARHQQADFILLSPVLPTTSHPGVSGMGWQAFGQYTRAAGIPVYALGGMQPRHLAIAKAEGAIGIAAISSLWEL